MAETRCPHCGFDFPDEPPPRKPTLLRSLVILGAILVAIEMLRGADIEDRSEVCVLCLQHAYVHEETRFGCVPVCRRRTLSQHHGGLMSSATFTAGGVPEASPDLYREIFDRPCSHDFRKGGFGRSSGLIHGDGSYMEVRVFLPRIQAIQALYSAYATTRNAAMAREAYRAIDTMFPAGPDLPWLPYNIRRYVGEDLFEHIVRNLSQVKTEGEWREATSQLAQFSALMARVTIATNETTWASLTNDIARFRGTVKDWSP